MTAAHPEHTDARTSVGPKRLSVLGATGSIGASTLDLVARDPDAFDIVALTAHTNAEQLAALAIRHRAKIAVIGDPGRYDDLTARLSGTGIRAAAGAEALAEAAAEPADCVVAAMVGSAGLKPTLAAIRQGRRVALANKETLVCAGALVMAEVAAAGTELLPVDSEHSAAFQAIGANDPDAIEMITLTASGGPFREWTEDQMASATPEVALKHPNWSMGSKVSIDSATLMNKGLELIEAFHLFPVGVARLSAVIHPQSIVHCLVAYRDGSVLAQLSAPDMRTPISLSLSWPRRLMAPTERLDLVKIGALTFEEPDERRFPALRIAREALQLGGSAPAVLNAANEVAVTAFLARTLPFPAIAQTVAAVLEAADARGLLRSTRDLDELLDLDRNCRSLARSMLDAYV